MLKYNSTLEFEIDCDLIDIEGTGENNEGSLLGGLVIASCVWRQHAHDSAPARYQTRNLNLTVFVSVFEFVFLSVSVYFVCICDCVCGRWRHAHQTLHQLPISILSLKLKKTGCGHFPTVVPFLSIC